MTALLALRIVLRLQRARRRGKHAIVLCLSVYHTAFYGNSGSRRN